MIPSATFPIDIPRARMLTTSEPMSWTQPIRRAPRTTQAMAGSQPQMTATAGPSMGAKNKTHTVYYGSEEYHSDGSHLQDRQDDDWEWEQSTTTQMVLAMNGMLLTPPIEIYDWKDRETMAEVLDEVRLGEIMETSEQSPTLEFYHAGLFSPLTYDLRHENLYYVRQDGEIVDKFIFDPDGDIDRNDLIAGEKGHVLPIEVELPPDEVSQIEVFAVPTPYKPYDDLASYTRDTNTLWLRYVPDGPKED